MSIHNRNAPNAQPVGIKTHKAKTNVTNVQADGYPTQNEEIAFNHRGLLLKNVKNMNI